MKKSLLLSAALAVVLFAGNALGVAVGRTKVNNKTGADIWVTFNKATFGCLGPIKYGTEFCSYNLVEKGQSRKTLSSASGSKLVVYGYMCKGGQVTQLPPKEFDVKTDEIDVTIEEGKIVVKDIGDSYSVKIEKDQK